MSGKRHPSTGNYLAAGGWNSCWRCPWITTGNNKWINKAFLSKSASKSIDEVDCRDDDAHFEGVGEGKINFPRKFYFYASLFHLQDHYSIPSFPDVI